MFLITIEYFKIKFYYKEKTSLGPFPFFKFSTVSVEYYYILSVYLSLPMSLTSWAFRSPIAMSYSLSSSGVTLTGESESRAAATDLAFPSDPVFKT